MICDYNAGYYITRDLWVKILQNDSITHNIDKQIILEVYKARKQGITATDIAINLNLKNYHFVSNSNVNFAKRICENYDVIPPKREDNSTIWWTIPYTDNPAGNGRYFFIIRTELSEAVDMLISTGII